MRWDCSPRRTKADYDSDLVKGSVIVKVDTTTGQRQRFSHITLPGEWQPTANRQQQRVLLPEVVNTLSQGPLRARAGRHHAESMSNPVDRIDAPTRNATHPRLLPAPASKSHRF